MIFNKPLFDLAVIIFFSKDEKVLFLRLAENIVVYFFLVCTRLSEKN